MPLSVSNLRPSQDMAHSKDRGASSPPVPKMPRISGARRLAGLTDGANPRFLKIAYNGPRALEEPASLDFKTAVAIRGGGTARRTIVLNWCIRPKNAARAALCGHKSTWPNAPLGMVRHMRAVADGAVAPPIVT